ncbi:hypothetical protein C8039_15265 [Halogeometricum sp. wsp3]|nr:hypothetical protein C8039_15265 [Halogeometricum sp. wsp3]
MRTLEARSKRNTPNSCSPSRRGKVAASAARATTTRQRGLALGSRPRPLPDGDELDWGHDRRFDGDGRRSGKRSQTSPSNWSIHTVRRGDRSDVKAARNQNEKRPGPRVAVQRPTSSVHAR